ANQCTQACPFFFSSRRRHTRFSRDWSSDVCSSDLGRLRLLEDDVRRRVLHHRVQEERGGLRHDDLEHHALPVALHLRLGDLGQRSEERRVGKEYTARWRQDQQTIKNTTQARGQLTY